jgi:hypothetical protein
MKMPKQFIGQCFSNAAVNTRTKNEPTAADQGHFPLGIWIVTLFSIPR